MSKTQTWSNDPALQALLPLQDLLEEAFGLDSDEDASTASEPLHMTAEAQAQEHQEITQEITAA